jgi:predicted nucleic acid-binding protein
MKLVVNTNILFSFFRETPVRKLIVNSESFGLELITPQYAFEELRNNKSELMKYSGIESEEHLEFIFSVLQFFIKPIPSESFKDCKEEAKKISPDVKDIPFFALALKFGCDIWSNEPRLKRQSRVKVFSTKELLEFLKLK